MNCDFLRPARFDDVLSVETIPGEAAGPRFELRQRVLRGDEVLFTADVRWCRLTVGGLKRLTAELLAALGEVITL